MLPNWFGTHFFLIFFKPQTVQHWLCCSHCDMRHDASGGGRCVCHVQPRTGLNNAQLAVCMPTQSRRHLSCTTGLRTGLLRWRRRRTADSKQGSSNVQHIAVRTPVRNVQHRTALCCDDICLEQQERGLSTRTESLRVRSNLHTTLLLSNCEICDTRNFLWTMVKPNSSHSNFENHIHCVLKETGQAQTPHNTQRVLPFRVQ